MAMFTTSYLLFFTLLLLAKKRGVNRIATDNGSLVYSLLLLWLHLAGIILFGFLPFCFSAVAKPAFFTSKGWQPLPTLFSLIFFGLALWFSFLLAKKQTRLPSPGERVPEMPYLAGYFLLRTFFIIAYEVWFRGFLLQGSLLLMPLSLAVVLNVVVYTLLHLVNDKKEWLLCMPFGTLLCILCLWHQTVWPAVFIHLALTLGYELTLVKNRITKTILYAHPRYRRIRLYRP